jgi:hypothetical protein
MPTVRRPPWNRAALHHAPAAPVCPPLDGSGNSDGSTVDGASRRHRVGGAALRPAGPAMAAGAPRGGSGREPGPGGPFGRPGCRRIRGCHRRARRGQRGPPRRAPDHLRTSRVSRRDRTDSDGRRGPGPARRRTPGMPGPGLPALGFAARVGLPQSDALAPAVAGSAQAAGRTAGSARHSRS